MIADYLHKTDIFISPERSDVGVILKDTTRLVESRTSVRRSFTHVQHRRILYSLQQLVILFHRSETSMTSTRLFSQDLGCFYPNLASWLLYLLLRRSFDIFLVNFLSRFLHVNIWRKSTFFNKYFWLKNIFTFNNIFGGNIFHASGQCPTDGAVEGWWNTS